jgi:transposase-like protein
VSVTRRRRRRYQSSKRLVEEDDADRHVEGDAGGPARSAGTFDPKLIAKYQRRFLDFDDKIISMYARGMTVREIRGHLEELYDIEVSPNLISTVTDAVLETVTEWQSRPLTRATCWCSSTLSA